MSRSFQKKRWTSWTHSKYETITPPELARMSGIMKTSRSSKMASASSVVGPLAASVRMRQQRLPAFFSVICSESAAGISTVQSRVSNSSLVT